MFSRVKNRKHQQQQRGSRVTRRFGGKGTSSSSSLDGRDKKHSRLSTSQFKAWCVTRKLRIILVIGMLIFCAMATYTASRFQLSIGPLNINKNQSRTLAIVLPSLVIGSSYKVSQSIMLPPKTGKDWDVSPSYGELVIHSLQGETSPEKFQRMIADNDYEEYEKICKEKIKAMNKENLSEEFLHEEELDGPRKCRPVSWKLLRFPTCNAFHELSMDRQMETTKELSDEYKYLGSGTYRDAWIFPRPDHDDFVLKRYMWHRGVAHHELSRVQREAIILERMSSSPRIVDIYGHCGTSMAIQAVAGNIHTRIVPGNGKADRAKLDALPDVHPMNNFTALEKLQMALDMAESLADLHGYRGGVMFHGDTHVEQWLLGRDGRVKLNDFNLAHILEWDPAKNQYCQRYTGKYGLTYRSPEEYTGGYSDEATDVYSYGNVIFNLLTGLWYFYDRPDRHHEERVAIRQGITKGERPYYDPRYKTHSYIEGKLIEAMELCWVHDKNKRPRIYEVVKVLREAFHTATNGDPNAVIRVSTT